MADNADYNTKKPPSSSSTLAIDEVRHLARLARIELTEAELSLCQQQLSEVIDYNIDLLSEIDVTGVEPTAQTTGLTNIWRADEPGLSLSVETALRNAPADQDNQFVVKKVLDDI